MALSLKGIAGGIDNGVPCFSAYASGTQGIGSGSATKVTLGAEDFDTDDSFSASRFTAKIAGYYNFDATLVVNTASITQVIAYFFKNGAEHVAFHRNNGSPGLSCFVSGGVSLYLGVGDYIEVYALITGTTIVLSGASPTATSRLTGFLIRPA